MDVRISFILDPSLHIILKYNTIKTFNIFNLISLYLKIISIVI